MKIRTCRACLPHTLYSSTRTGNTIPLLDSLLPSSILFLPPFHLLSSPLPRPHSWTQHYLRVPDRLCVSCVPCRSEQALHSSVWLLTRARLHFISTQQTPCHPRSTTPYCQKGQPFCQHYKCSTFEHSSFHDSFLVSITWKLSLPSRSAKSTSLWRSQSQLLFRDLTASRLPAKTTIFPIIASQSWPGTNRHRVGLGQRYGHP